uniref:Uncharacterized protein n=1 Tax=Physcomitrium patens TaxID=3218 RepID=A0A2K1L096_PHYPA|nr:hypothetical protein PHYPA_002237 [Physcomitrium patens]
MYVRVCYFLFMEFFGRRSASRLVVSQVVSDACRITSTVPTDLSPSSLSGLHRSPDHRLRFTAM